MLQADGSVHDLHDGPPMLHEESALHLLPHGATVLHPPHSVHDLHDGRAVLHEACSVHDLHHGSADLHPQGPLLRAALRNLSDLPLCHALRASSGAMLYDPLRPALCLPAGPGASLLPAADLCRPASRQLRRSQPGHLCSADSRGSGPGSGTGAGHRQIAQDGQQAQLIRPT